MEGQEPTLSGWRWPFWYRRHVLWGRLCGALRVLVGKNASIPVGLHNTGTALGQVRVKGYYGGCVVSLPEADLYWRAWDFDGWGAGCGQGKFDRAYEAPPEAP
jgi:hypothetical protein